ncbi:sugar phosphate nucleotidyltransferase [bacterium]|nr:sugar phosphate nucleotidyltransferase [bacterium]
MTDRTQNKDSHFEIVGLIPAGGKGKRIAPLPCSKELYPVGFDTVDQGHRQRPKVVCHYLLENLRIANITKAYIVLREGKWDIPAYFRDGKMLDMNLAYLIMDLPHGVPFTLDQAYPFIKDAIIAFGFPDIIFQPEDAYVQLLSRQKESNADIVLGLFLTRQPHKMDMVDLDDNGKLRQIQIKPKKTHLRYTWIIAVWQPSFTHFMHEYVLAIKEKGRNSKLKNTEEIEQELFVGHIIQAALAADMRIDTVSFHSGSCIDIGTPEDLVRAVDALT